MERQHSLRRPAGGVRPRPGVRRAKATLTEPAQITEVMRRMGGTGSSRPGSGLGLAVVTEVATNKQAARKGLNSEFALFSGLWLGGEDEGPTKK
jgi:hypothetical protein